MLKNIPSAEDSHYISNISSLNITNENAKMLLDFSRDGYVVVDLNINNFELFSQKIISDLAVHYKGGHRIQDAHRIQKEVKLLACNKIIESKLEILYGRKPFPFQTLNFDVGTEQATHSDAIHFHSYPERFMCGVWVALEDTDVNNGPLHYYPGSHKLPISTLVDINIAASRKKVFDYYDYDNYYVPMIKDVILKNKINPVEAYLKRGQAFIWATNLLHGGSPIRQNGRTRHSQVTHYYFDDCLYYTPLWSDPVIGKIHYRSPFNISTGKLVKNYYCGKRMRSSIRHKLKEILYNAFSYTVRA
jgi:ectoine hydroxylase-related dioxygenase (phytanoyl-CoA dioxygenase family)